MDDHYRRIIISIFVLSLAATTIFTIFTHLPAGPGSTNNVEVITQNRQVMGTIVTVDIIGPGTGAKDAIDSSFDEIERIEGLMSTYDPDSEISVLNAEGEVGNVSGDFIFVIEQSIHYGSVSGGAFDITIKPILDLWKNKISAGEFPTGQDINKTLLLVNYSNVSVNDSTISFKAEGMSITVDGIAKGYAVDRAVEVLKENGYTNGFVNAGGDGMYFGTKLDGTKWRVGLRNPENKSQYITIMEITDMAVATSGNYERYFNESARLSHISDPGTGYSSQSLMSATVIAPTAMDADALATAVFVLGPQDGMELIENTGNTECLLITADREIMSSSGFGTYEVPD